MKENKNYYCVFGIGPVQSFIAASRKLEDLWGGSYLLSFLVRQAIYKLDQLRKQYNIEHNLIFPQILDEGVESVDITVANYPNRITFELKNSSEDIVHQLLEELEASIYCELVRISDWCVERVFGENRNNSQQQIERLKLQAKQQVIQFLEVNWIAHPGAASESLSYREEAEKMFQAFKGQRPINVQMDVGIACTLYQQMDALCMEEPSSEERYGDLRRKLSQTWAKRHQSFKPNSTDDPDKARIRDNEFLCGISLVRRVARDFFTAEFRLSPKVFAKYESVVNIGPLKDKGYYAVLLMDGDNMGPFFKGEEKSVKKTSEKLSVFATRTVPTIVKKHDGVLLYAGGDDVLALFPIQTVLKAAFELRKGFSDSEHGLSGATASTGIAIGHKRTPLQQMLQEARILEKAAKEFTEGDLSVPTKNAFALSVLPRSGEYLGPLVLPWTSQDTVVTDSLEQIVALLGEVVSTSFIYSLATSFQPLVEYSLRLPDSQVEEMVLLECYRLVDRSVYDLSKRDYVYQKLSCLPDMLRLVKLGGIINLLKIMAFFDRKEVAHAPASLEAR